jgi:hypothetical protein
LDKPIYSGYCIFFGVIDDFHHIPDTLPPPNADTLDSMINHPSGIVQVSLGTLYHCVVLMAVGA